jgi:hypothetical protein
MSQSSEMAKPSIYDNVHVLVNAGTILKGPSNSRSLSSTPNNQSRFLHLPSKDTASTSITRDRSPDRSDGTSTTVGSDKNYEAGSPYLSGPETDSNHSSPTLGPSDLSGPHTSSNEIFVNTLLNNHKSQIDNGTIIWSGFDPRTTPLYNVMEERKEEPSESNKEFGLEYTDLPITTIYAQQPKTAVRCLTSTVSRKIQFKRAGIIPYATFNGVRYYLMAIDSKYNELTDFGGQVKNRESFLDAACREFHEESLGFFDYTSDESKALVRESSFAIHDERDTIILFQEIECTDPTAIVEEYKRRAAGQGVQENIGVLWIPDWVFVHLYTTKETYQTIEGAEYPKMYCRVSDLVSIVQGIFDSPQLDDTS